MSGLSSPPNGLSVRGRKPIPRADRLAQGLPVCINPECNRAPARRKRCRPCYESTAHPGHTPGVPSICTSVLLPVELHQRAVVAVHGVRGGFSALVREALTEKLDRPCVNSPST